MKVQILYILDLGIAGGSATTRNAEAAAVCNGLFSKYRGRCGAVGVLELTRSGTLTLDKDHRDGPLPLRNAALYQVDQVQTARLQEQAAHLLDKTLPHPSVAVSKDKNVPDRAVGAYVVMHSHGLQAIEVAEHLDNVLPATAKQRLHYVVMLSCGMAEDPPGTYELKRSEAPFMNQLMAELKGREMRPVLAGWDVYITAAPHRPGNQRDVYDGAGDRKIADLKAIPGRKIVQPKDPTFAKLNREYRTVFNEYRQLHKKVYQIDKDGKLSVKLGTWSQK